MVPVKTAHEYDMIQEITVLFSETVQRQVKEIIFRKSYYTVGNKHWYFKELKRLKQSNSTRQPPSGEKIVYLS